MDRAMIVTHEIDRENHVVRIYPPGKPYELLNGCWPVSEMTSLDAIWAGFDRAMDECRYFDADSVAVHSADAEAFAAFQAELDADE